MADPDIIAMRPTAPPTAIHHSDAGWSGRDRCTATGTSVLATVPLSTDFTLANSRRNNAAAFFAERPPDHRGRSPLPAVPPAGVATLLVRYPDADLYGDGIQGAHGGSGMSSIGGTIRVGELRPGQ